MAASQNELNQALQNLITMNGKKIEIKKVWTNASPTSAFAAQTVKVQLPENAMVIIKHRYTTTTERYGMTLCKVGETCIMSQMPNAQSTSVVYVSRDVSVTTTGVTFGAGYGKSITSTSAGSANATNLPPVEIYSVKGVI